jgi:Ser/Thr protein kinase RdoA (MazF antagonist)
VDLARELDGRIDRWVTSEALRSGAPALTEQRHMSTRVELSDGTRGWLKVDRAGMPLAGVQREAEVLQSNGHVAGLPRVLAAGTTASGRPFLLATEVPGTPLSQRADLVDHLPAIARWLIGFSSTAAVMPYPLGAVATWDLYGPRPDLHRLAFEAAAWAEGRIARPVQLGSDADLPTAVVHGSFDPANVLVDDDGRVGVLDLEATRLGPTVIDVAGMGCRLAPLGSAPAWQVAVEAVTDLDHGALVGFTALRLWHLRQASGDTEAAFTAGLDHLGGLIARS